jgi:hypothetical protein
VTVVSLLCVRGVPAHFTRLLCLSHVVEAKGQAQPRLTCTVTFAKFTHQILRIHNAA